MVQLKNEQIAIQSAIDHYYQGVISADTSLLTKAFDVESGHWKGISVNVNQKECVKVETISESIDRWRKGSYSNTSGEVVSTEIIDNKLAIVKFLFVLDDKEYLDVLSLFKLNGSWKIINKIFVER